MPLAFFLTLKSALNYKHFSHQKARAIIHFYSFLSLQISIFKSASKFQVQFKKRWEFLTRHSINFNNALGAAVGKKSRRDLKGLMLFGGSKIVVGKSILIQLCSVLNLYTLYNKISNLKNRSSNKQNSITLPTL